ncbi:MAG: MarR family transcriptional regulator [Pseudoflavonifractor sp.]
MGVPANKRLIDATYTELNRYANEIYEFVIKYNEYIYQARDYGNGDPMKMVEVHTLSMIEDHPGITVSELAKLWMRTKGTVSVNVSTLEQKGYIYRQKEGNNAKVVHLYLTPEGVELSTIHKSYDNLDIVQTQNDLLKSCSPEELDSFYKVLHAYLLLLTEEE